MTTIEDLTQNLKTGAAKIKLVSKVKLFKV